MPEHSKLSSEVSVRGDECFVVKSHMVRKVDDLDEEEWYVVGEHAAALKRFAKRILASTSFGPLEKNKKKKKKKKTKR